PEGHYGGEWAAELRAESFQRTDTALAQERGHLVALELAAGHGFPDDQLAARALVGSEGFLQLGCAARLAGHLHGLALSAHFLADAAPLLVNDLGGQLADLRHVLLAGELAALHLLALDLPATREFGLGERFRMEVAQQRDQREAL